MPDDLITLTFTFTTTDQGLADRIFAQMQTLGLNTTVTTIEIPTATPEVQAEITRLVRWSERLAAASPLADIPDDQNTDALNAAIAALDQRVGEGLRPGRLLFFYTGDGVAQCLVTEVERDRIRCVQFADETSPDAIDADGYCLRSIAEAQIARRDRERPIIV